MDCIFCKIVQGEIPANIVFESPDCIAIQDLNPQAPSHFLILPKKHIATIHEASTEDEQLLGRMVISAQKIARQTNLDKGYRLVFNVNAEGGQTVYHIHLHVLGGRQMTWPPG